MLEGLVAWVLNNYLGKYVENLNTDQLSVALLSGKVELENLPLKKDALRHLGLPVEIRAGFIGKVQLHVPVRQIRSAPWIIAIEKLYLVAAPVNLDEWDSAVEAAYAHERKVALLDALEAQWRAEHEANDAGYYATSYSSWLSYGTGLLANIVENLQLKLNDVHIRYEDALTCPGHAFACGLTVESLVAESCDATWQRGFTPLDDPCTFKLLELQNLAIYWDPMQVPTGMMSDCTIAELTDRMCGTWKNSHSYVLSPAGASARVRRERTDQPLRDRHRPRLAAHLTLAKVQLRLTSRQYGEVCGCARGLERVARLREVRALRPPVPVRGHARAWWRYALKAHAPHHTWMEPKPTWESCGERARRVRQYVDICYETLCNPAGTLPADRKAAKDDFEWTTPLAILKPLREIAMRKVPVSTPASTPEQASSGRSVLVRWFPQWWGWYAPPPGEPAPAAPPPGEPAPAAAPAPAAPRLEDEILDVIADSLDDNTLLRRDALFGLFEFTLHRGSLDLCDDDASVGEVSDGEARGTGVELQFSLVRARVESRPRAGAHALHVSLGGLALRERVTPRTLFPVLVAPQGLIRDGLSNAASAAAGQRRPPPTPAPAEPLFQLSYERRPAGHSCDYKLRVRCTSLEVVWCPAVAQWARRWASTGGVSGALQTVRTRTRATLSHWGRMLHAPTRSGERGSWHVELDVSAPTLLLAEQLAERDGAVLVLDFGRLRLAPATAAAPPPTDRPNDKDDDEEMFMTPCSTPPGSLLSPGSPPAPPPPSHPLDPAHLHTSLYDRYKIELSDLQILVGRARDNWKYAHTKATSALHLLDRFSISLQAERRVVQTSDPQYPGAALCGSLPALVAHLSEHKLAAVRAVLARALPAAPPHPAPSPAPRPAHDECDAADDDDCSSDVTEPTDLSHHHNATLFILQFAIDQMSLEVQSRGRSIAEVQVCGVRAAMSARPADVALSLSVHSLLLVDALQTFGPDFELLVASHRHLGMDTASGSIRGSEPTSPTSPSSPGARAPSPLALHRALHSLHAHEHESERTSPGPAWPPGDWSGPGADSIWGPDVFGWGGPDAWSSYDIQWASGAGPDGGGWSAPGLVDTEALIAVELCLVKGEGNSEDLRIANILFNNLDVIANQETIVELIGFGHRVCGAAPAQADAAAPTDVPDAPSTPPPRNLKRTRTEITFDFHRLGVLLLRASVRDAAPAAHKLATATVGDARIQATLDGERVEVVGSLGGVQVVSLCEGAGVHSRVLQAGRVPPAPAAPAASAASAPPPQHAHDEKALQFTIARSVTEADEDDDAEVEVRVSVHVASVWYTHSGPLLRELRSCAAQFRRYLAELARSVRAAAADMALGLVQPRDPLYASSRLAHSLDALEPRRRFASLSLDDEPPPPAIVLSVSVELESPVVVLPRAARSAQVAVAHLGRMSLANRPGPPRDTEYNVHVRDISLVALDISDKLVGGALSATDGMSEIYDVSRGRAVLHEAALRLSLSRASGGPHVLAGAVVGGLHVTASREQYEQLLETLRWMSDAPGEPPAPQPQPQPVEAGSLAEGAVPTLRLEPALRAALQPPPLPAPPPPKHSPLLVTFEVASFTVELRADLGGGERSLVALTCREFTLRHDHLLPHETTLQVSLHSITMEDLTQPPESTHRMLMVSHSPPAPRKAVYVSASCPDFVSELRVRPPRRVRARSLPAQPGHPAPVTRPPPAASPTEHRCGPTPPSSPVRSSDDNLVWVCVHTRLPRHDATDAEAKVSKTTKVDFNCLKLVLSIDSWVAVLDFFGVAGDEAEPERPADGSQPVPSESSSEAGELEVCVRSLWVVVVGARGDACRAHVSRVRVCSTTTGASRLVRARLGALTLTDLAPRAVLWRDRLRTRTADALTLNYHRLSPSEAAAAGYETSLSLEMGPLTYVHTRRFVLELQAFATDFSLLRRVIAQARRKVSRAVRRSSAPQRMSLSLRCTAPLIVLPVSGRSRAALAAELQLLTLTNRFCYADDPDTISTLRDPTCEYREVLDVRSVRAEGLSLWCVRGGASGGSLRRCGAPLLPAPAELCLQIERNCSDTHNVADMSVHGRLSTLRLALDAAQYRLVRGVLAHNLAEPCDELLPPPPRPMQHDQVWTTWSLKLELQDVIVQLRAGAGGSGAEGEAALACINFIKSRLLVESYSDLSQDIDLVSAEILVSDTRYAAEPANRRANVFSHIVAPLPEQRHSVQAEVHARKRPDSSAYTILINNMRLMAILDWWEAANQFIMQAPLPASDPDLQHLEEINSGCEGGTSAGGVAERAPPFELKLNVTDSQLVLVEDTAVWDTNAVILKCSTVVTYRAADAARPVVCELSELELFSCVLGLEEETALAILDPAAAHLALTADNQLQIAMGTLNLRLSYHDMRMFAAILQSLPVQARLALSGKSEDEPPANKPANSVHMQAGVGVEAGVGFNKGAGLGLARWARDAPTRVRPPPEPTSRSLRLVQVSAESVTLCVIDDCLDSDVPLLEVTLADLHLDQDLRKAEESFEDPLLVSTPSGGGGALPGVEAARRGAGGGRVRGVLSVDYYNRALSGWEPVVEPWRADAWWEYTLCSSLTRARLQLELSSADLLNINVTSALVDLLALVRTNWTADYYAPQAPRGSPKGSPAGHRRRSPFVPYALHNLTGQRLWFTTLTTAVDEVRDSGESEKWGGPDDTWVMVRAGETEPFSFGGRRSRAPAAAPAAATPAPLHRLVLRLDHWTPPDPVCVDRVGVFFRDITHIQSGGVARVVLEVSLEGSARKLVTVRSALLLHNRLPHPVELRLDRSQAPGAWGGASGGAASAGTVVEAGARWAAPLVARAAAVWARPVLRARPAPPPAAIDWCAASAAPDHAVLLHHECRTANDQSYRFSCAVVRERFPMERGEPLAGHTLTLLPALRLENLLPLELQYRAASDTGALPPAHTHPFHQVNVEEGVEVSVKLEGFGWSSPLVVGGAGATGSFSARLKLRDQRGRRLYLNARVTVKKTDGIKVSVSAAYWLVNRTGLPLVFRAEGGAEAAGQFAEHELARMVAPLPFAFADGDGPTISARLGNALSPRPEWCSPFGLGPGVTVKRLESAGAGEERSYVVGVHVRAGRGRHRRTNVVTLTPRYQLHNNTSRCLQFAQKCTATTLNDPGAVATHVSAVAGCYLPWHWARWEREQLLCVRVLAPPPATTGPTTTTNTISPEPLTAWSGGFRIDKTRSLHIACREKGGSYQVLRVEVVPAGAALLVVLTDAERAPPPLRVDNRSRVAVVFGQAGGAEECVAGAGAAPHWALPEPEGAQALALRAPGGPRLTLPLDALHHAHTLLYQNFLYVAFTRSRESSLTDSQSSATDDNVLVLEVPMGSTRVVLARKRYGDRSQLWRRGPNEQLVHEGSSPPQPTDALSDDAPLSPHAMVLDIEEAAPRPGRAAALVLRRADPRRASTQAWRLLPGARMACAHANLCVQPDNGLLGLTPGNRVVLGMPGSPRAGATPPEQAVEWHTLRPGSGRLTVALSTDGPTRLVRIYDQNDPEAQRALDGGAEEVVGGREWCAGVSLAGVGVSLVGRSPPTELVYAQLLGLRLELARRPRTARAALTVRDMQWDNQLTGTPSPVLLHSWGGASASGAALHAALELQHAPPRSYNAVYCNHLVLALRPLAVRLEERLILLLWAWAGGGAEEGAEQADEAEFETRRVLLELTALHATRYYFALVKVIPGQIRLSMFTANKLEGSLSALKRRLGLTLIRFEDAAVELEPFVRAHAFDTAATLARQMLQHFKDELKWQAAKILGSVDFLGNPLGFVADVSEGVSGLLLEGNVGALLKNVTHGISNSAAKVSETLGDGLERVVADEAHEETRRRIRAAAAGAHLAAGLRGFGLGLLGGVTSLVKHSYEGAASEGLPGFITGVGKGLVGTVTKPVIGVLDLAAETAAALRDTSRRAGAEPQRARPPRPVAADAPLARYCPRAAEGAELLRALARDADERFLAYRIVRDTPHDIRAILSDTHLRIFTCKHGAPQLVLEAGLGALAACSAVDSGGAWFVELGVRGGGGGAAGEGGLRRPRVQCDTQQLAQWLATHAAHARRLHRDKQHTLPPRHA